MGGLGFNGLGWVCAIHTLLNGPKWVIGVLRTQPIYYPSKPTHLTPLASSLFSLIHSQTMLDIFFQSGPGLCCQWFSALHNRTAGILVNGHKLVFMNAPHWCLSVSSSLLFLRFYNVIMVYQTITRAMRGFFSLFLKK